MEGDVWLPLGVVSGKRKKSSSLVLVEDYTPVALCHLESQEMVFNRRDILSKLQLLVIRSTTQMELAPDDVPDGYELFIRWDKPASTKLIPAGSYVLHHPMTNAQAMAEGAVSAPPLDQNSAAGKKRSRRAASTVHGSTTAADLSFTIAEGQRRVSQYKENEEELEKRLCHEMHSNSNDKRPQNGVFLELRKGVVKRISEWSGKDPLHVTSAPPPAAVELPSGCIWNRPSPYVLFRVVHSNKCREQRRTADHDDASRQLAIFFVDGVIVAPVVSSLVQPEETAQRYTDDRKESVASAMKQYADRGFRVVLVDHYPSLHHGNRIAQEAKLLPIVDFCKAYLLEKCSVTILLSVMSNISATKEHGSGQSFLLPNAGLLNYFTSHHNSSLATDTKSSVVVGCSRRGSPFLDGMHKDFAVNTSLRFVDVEEMLLECKGAASTE